MKVIVPTGVGDSCWAMFKVQAVRDKQDPGGPIDVYLVGAPGHAVDSRALDFVNRFYFVNSAHMKPCSIHAGSLYRPDGTYNYIEDGWYEFDGERYCVLIPNAALEHGIRLEDWLPQYAINWDIFDHFHMTVAERVYAADLHARIGDFAVFYPGPLHGNTVDGHNRGALWKPADWLELGRRVHEEYGLHIVTVGAPYDASYHDLLLAPELAGVPYWTNIIGQTNLGQLWSVTSRAKFVVSYQAGVGIISTYLGTPTAIFWRPHGNSINPIVKLTFDERMASAWVPPKVLDAGGHLPLYYGRHDPAYIMAEVARRGWATARVRAAS